MKRTLRLAGLSAVLFSLSAILFSFLFLADNNCYSYSSPIGSGQIYGSNNAGSIILTILWIMLLFMTGIGIYYYVKNLETSKTPLEVLNKRLAGGKLTREEYEQIKLDLK